MEAGSELPRDPDTDHIPDELQILAGTNHGRVTVLDDDGVGPATLVLVPGLFGHAARLTDDE